MNRRAAVRRWSPYFVARREEEKDRRRAQIVDAAEAICREFDLDALTMANVARRARLSRALLYLYFKDKYELQLAIATRAASRLLISCEAAGTPAASGIEKIEAIGFAYLSCLRESPYLFDVWSEVELLLGRRINSRAIVLAYIEHAQRLDDLIVAALRAGEGDGTIRMCLDDVRTMSRLLWGCMRVIAQMAIERTGSVSGTDIAFAQCELQASVLLRQLLAQSNDVFSKGLHRKSY